MAAAHGMIVLKHGKLSAAAGKGLAVMRSRGDPAMAKKKAAKKAHKRELKDTGQQERFVRRNDKGEFKKWTTMAAPIESGY
jgi:hypothetical protein